MNRGQAAGQWASPSRRDTRERGGESVSSDKTEALSLYCPLDVDGTAHKSNHNGITKTGSTSLETRSANQLQHAVHHLALGADNWSGLTLSLVVSLGGEQLFSFLPVTRRNQEKTP